MRDWAAYVRERLALNDFDPARESRIVRELATQLEDVYREAIAAGTGEAEADAHARAQITDWPAFVRAVRHADARHRMPPAERMAARLEDEAGSGRKGLLMLAHFVRDVRYAMRQLTLAPGFAVFAILTIALGIGATTAMFSVVNGVLLRPLPYPEPDRLVRVFEIVPRYGRFSVAPATFLDWRAQHTSFEHIVAFGSTTATFAGDAGPERVPGAIASWDIFGLLKVAPLIGSGFTADHDKPALPAPIVLSYDAWQRRYGGDAAIVGRRITVNGDPATIIGVMPEGFYFPNREAQFWRPLPINPANASRGGHSFGVLARLKPDRTVADAMTEMKGISERLAVQYPDFSADESAEVVEMQGYGVSGIRNALLTLFAAVGLVVLIACANVANLLLVRASVREREIAVRTALGASRPRLVLQMLAESLVIATAGGGLGVALGALALAPIRTLGAGSVPRAADIVLDGRVLAFATLATLVTGLVFGLAPAWQASRAGVNVFLKEGGRSLVTARSAVMRNALLVAEVALSIVLLTGAALLLRSFDRLTDVDPGFNPDPVLAFQVSLPPRAYPDEPRRIQFFQSLLEKLDAHPGVQSAGMVQTLPMRGDYMLSFTIRGRAPDSPGRQGSANYRTVSPRYFETLGIPVRRGRAFGSQDTSGGQRVAVVDEAFARKHFSDANAIGQGLAIGNGGGDGVYEIVGVVGDVHHGGLEATADATMYVPFEQDVFSSMWVLARATGQPAALAGLARQAVLDVDPALPAYSIAPMTDVVSESVAGRRFSMLLLAAFAGVALFLAAVGLYGVVAYMVSQRTREIGLRMAIGAGPLDVMWMVVRGGMQYALIGIAAGLAGALALGRFVETMLFDVTPWDPVSYAVTTVVLVGITLLACVIPARRAMRVDPIVAMHAE